MNNYYYQILMAMKDKLLVTDVFKALADENSFGLFNTICTRCTDSQKLIVPLS